MALPGTTLFAVEVLAKEARAAQLEGSGPAWRDAADLRAIREAAAQQARGSVARLLDLLSGLVAAQAALLETGSARVGDRTVRAARPRCRSGEEVSAVWPAVGSWTSPGALATGVAQSSRSETGRRPESNPAPAPDEFWSAFDAFLAHLLAGRVRLVCVVAEGA